MEYPQPSKQTTCLNGSLWQTQMVTSPHTLTVQLSTPANRTGSISTFSKQHLRSIGALVGLVNAIIQLESSNGKHFMKQPI